MALLLVDDRDGRIVAEIDTVEDAERILEAWTRDDGGLPAYLCVVEVSSRHGAFVGTDTSVKVRPLQGP